MRLSQYKGTQLLPPSTRETTGHEVLARERQQVTLGDALMCTTRRRIPVSASAHQGPDTRDLMVLLGGLAVGDQGWPRRLSELEQTAFGDPVELYWMSQESGDQR